MPWRWRPWSNNYNQVLTQWGNDLVDLYTSGENSSVSGGFSGFEETRGLAEQRKKQVNKLTTRMEKVTAVEKQLEVSQQIGIVYDEKTALKKQAEKGGKAKVTS